MTKIIKDYFIKGIIGTIVGLSFSNSGCVSNINSDALKIMSKYDEIKNMVNAEPNDLVQVNYSGDKSHLGVIIYRKEEVNNITFYDDDRDGKYDRKQTIIIPKKLELIIPDINVIDEWKGKIKEKKNLETFSI